MGYEVKDKGKQNYFLQDLKDCKIVAMLAPCFVAEWKYPGILFMLKKLGFDKVVELTFGAKIVNREYHKILKSSKGLVISSVCPGVVETIKNNYPRYVKNLIKVDSPMVAMAKICRKNYPGHKICFISPCNFKKIEAQDCNQIDYVFDFQQMNSIFSERKIGKPFFKKRILFDKFYNDYTKVYPLSGGLTKTVHLKGILKKEECLCLDGMKKIGSFLDNPGKKIRFLDVTFCVGGCVGGCYSSDKNLKRKTKKVLNYLQKARQEDIPENRKGLISKARGLKFRS